MKEGLYIKIIHKCLQCTSCWVCVSMCVCTEMAILWKVKQGVACFSSVARVVALRSGRPGITGPSCWARASLSGPPGPYWSLDVKLPPPTHSWIFASQSVLERLEYWSHEICKAACLNVESDRQWDPAGLHAGTVLHTKHTSLAHFLLSSSALLAVPLQHFSISSYVSIHLVL